MGAVELRLSPIEWQIQQIGQELDRRRMEAHLHEFVKQAWAIIEPGVPYVDGWHIQVICEHLEAITDGEIKRLLINIPPRHAKSSIVSVLWPVWEWISRPSEKYLCASYSGVLSTRDAVKSRRLIQSPWFQERWGHVFALTADQNAKQRYENDKTGYRIATSVGGTATGEGGSRLILDDPHGAQSAQSDAIRETDLEWFNTVWSTRLNDEKTSAMVTIMQRLHEGDISGRILELGGWEHICLPAEWDGLPRKTFLGQYDPRTSVGQLLWEERFDQTALARLKKVLGEYGVAGQLQQVPTPTGGGILKTDHFQLWPRDRPLPVIEYCLQSYDTAFTDDTVNDPSACTVWGVFTYKKEKCVVLLDCWSEFISYPDLRQRLIDDWHVTYGGEPGDNLLKPRKADLCLIEEKGSGIALVRDLQRAKVMVGTYNPGKASKRVRAHSVAPILEMDCIYLLESKKDPGQVIAWARPFKDQVQKFPNDNHDDYVDTFTQAMILIRDKDMLDMPEAPPDEEEDVQYEKKIKVNPYG